MACIIGFLENEFWYPGIINDGYKFPLNNKSKYFFDFNTNFTYNQINPVLFSSRGRYIWADKCKINIENGEINIEGDFDLNEEGNCLKDAVINARKNHYFYGYSISDRVLKNNIQYCTWMYLQKNQNQEGILEYSESIVGNGLPAGLLIIDDGWQKSFGEWSFNENFASAKTMVNRLHELGFTVSLWIVPYVSEKSGEFDFLNDNDYLVKTSGKTFFANTFLGKLAVLNLFDKRVCDWLKKTLDSLRLNFGIDGFKFDGGDAMDLSGANFNPVDYNEIWNTFFDYDIIEYRSTYKSAGLPKIQRLADKGHIWDVMEIFDKNISDTPFLKYGLSCIIPNTLIQGISGYWYSCPDMVGGGLSSDLSTGMEYDKELVIRSCQTEIFMPFIQFSFPFWVEDSQIRDVILDLFEKRKQVQNYITNLMKNVEKNGEPIVRFLEYEFPHQNLEKITDEFMLGDRYLIAPVIEKGQVLKEIVLPKGCCWRDVATGTIYKEDTVKIAVNINSLPMFERVKEEVL